MEQIDQEWRKQYASILKTGDIQGAWDLKRKYQPATFFKYQSFADPYSIQNLLNNVIYLSNANELDDAFDSGFYLDVDKIGGKIIPIEEIRKLGEGNVSDDFWPILEQMIQNANDKLVKDINTANREHFNRIFCLSEKNNSNQMWGLYADKHRGFCVEYEVDVTLWNGTFDRCLFPVIYEKEIFDLTPFYISEDFKINFIGNILSSIFKTVNWDYQYEWRLIMANGVWKDYPLTYMAPPVKALYIGERVSQENKKILIDISKYKSVPIFQGSGNVKTASIEFKKVK